VLVVFYQGTILGEHRIANALFDQSIKKVNPQIWWCLLLIYPNFSGAEAAQF
jgi:hypothetical protein